MIMIEKWLFFTLISKKKSMVNLTRNDNFKIENFQPSHRANARRTDESICSVFCQMRRKRNARRESRCSAGEQQVGLLFFNFWRHDIFQLRWSPSSGAPIERGWTSGIEEANCSAGRQNCQGHDRRQRLVWNFSKTIYPIELWQNYLG